MNERIRELRKQLGLNQTEFGAKIGLSQRAVASMESGGTITDRNFDAICKAFSVKPEWLRKGVGEIFLETREALIQTVAAEFGLTGNEIVLLRMYLDLPAECRAGVINFAKKFVASIDPQYGKTVARQAKSDDELTPDEKAEIVRRESLEEAEAKKTAATMSSASIGTSGTSKKFSGGS